MKYSLIILLFISLQGISQLHDSAQFIRMPKAKWYTAPGTQKAIYNSVTFRTSFPDSIPPQGMGQDKGWHFADSNDVKTIKGAQIRDVIIEGAHDEKPVYDTMRVIMLCADTAWILNGTPVVKGTPWSSRYSGVFWIEGYEVRNVESVYEDVNHTTLAICIMKWVKYYTHYTYLTEDKKPLTYFVWQSKPLQ